MAETTQSGGRGVSLAFEEYGKNGLYIWVRRDGILLGSMRRSYRWVGWLWHPKDGGGGVMLGRDTYRAKVKLRELLA